MIHPTPPTHSEALPGIDTLPLGTVYDDGEQCVRFCPPEPLLHRHIAVFGGTRFGKSKLFELLCRLLIALGQGLAFIDPHSDTADDLFAYLSYHYDELGLTRNKIHYLNPSEKLFAFDPFIYRPNAENSTGNAEFDYRSWLDTTVKDMVKIILRQQGETEAQQQTFVTLRRWLYNGLYAVGVRQDEENTHEPMRNIFILLNPNHPKHPEVYRRVEPFLAHPDGGDEVWADFEKLRAVKDPRRQEDWVSSTFNRLRDVFSPVVLRMFDQEAESIDFVEIIQRGGIILASLGKTRHVHEDSAHAIAGLLIRQIIEAVRTIERERRQQFYLLIDEAQNFINEDFKMILKETAKYRLSCGLAVQQIDNLQHGDTDVDAG